MFHSRLSPAQPASLAAERLENPPQIEEAPLVQVWPKRLADHRRGECIWPLGPIGDAGDWRTLFCCAPVKDQSVSGRRYCAEHAARAFLPDAEEQLP
jgi:hypothetical protein